MGESRGFKGFLIKVENLRFGLTFQESRPQLLNEVALFKLKVLVGGDFNNQYRGRFL